MLFLVRGLVMWALSAGNDLLGVFMAQGLPVKPPNYVYKQRVAPGVVVREQKAPAAASRAPGSSTAGTARKAKKRPAASRGFEMSATMA